MKDQKKLTDEKKILRFHSFDISIFKIKSLFQMIFEKRKKKKKKKVT
jgi:hypothetical protein